MKSMFAMVSSSPLEALLRVDTGTSFDLLVSHLLYRMSEGFEVEVC